MTFYVNINKLFFDIRKNEMKPYDVGQVLLIKDGIALVSVSDLKRNKFLHGMALNLESQQIGWVTFADDVVEVLYLLEDTPSRLCVECRQKDLILGDSLPYDQLIQFCIYPIFAFLGSFILISHWDFDNIFELSMLTGFLKTAQKVGNITPQIGRASYATYRVDNTDPTSTTHEQSQKNPLLKKNNGNAYQHPTIVRSTCEIPDCEHKLCKQPCAMVIEDADVGHVTHGESYPGVQFVSKIDCSGKQHVEYILPYVPPIENTTQGLNVNPSKTTNLNNNNEAMNNVHMNSSRLPIQKAFTGSNDTTNIN